MAVRRVLGPGPRHTDVTAVCEAVLEELDVGGERVVHDWSSERGLCRRVDVAAPVGPPARREGR